MRVAVAAAVEGGVGQVHGADEAPRPSSAEIPVEADEATAAVMALEVRCVGRTPPTDDVALLSAMLVVGMAMHNEAVASTDHLQEAIDAIPPGLRQDLVLAPAPDPTDADTMTALARGEDEVETSSHNEEMIGRTETEIGSTMTRPKSSLTSASGIEMRLRSVSGAKFQVLRR